MNDYYNILELKYKYSTFGLFRNYMKKTKETLTSENKEDFVKVRMAFEVLCDEDVLEDYNRIYRKYVLNQDLNYPKVREEEMIANYHKNEQKGHTIANEVIRDGDTYKDHLWTFIFQFIGNDLVRLINYYPYRCGLAYMIIGIILLFTNHQPERLIFCPMFIVLGFFVFRNNIINTIMA